MNEQSMEKPEKRVLIHGASPALRDTLPEDGMAISDFPFVVGRRPTKSERVPVTSVNLKIDDERPYRLSRTHFSVLKTANGFVLVDSGSVLGTTVNGQPVGKSSTTNRVPLNDGENEIIAGGLHSPYKFLIVVEKNTVENPAVT